MITAEQYEQARQQRAAAEEIMNEYHKQQRDAFDERMKTNPIFTDDELVYSAMNLCPCGHGLAYPKDCGINHHWDCSAILKGIHDKTVEHTAQLPFMYYGIKSEGQPSAHGHTTRGVFKPKPAPVAAEGDAP